MKNTEAVNWSAFALGVLIALGLWFFLYPIKQRSCVNGFSIIIEGAKVYPETRDGKPVGCCLCDYHTTYTAPTGHLNHSVLHH